MPDILEHLSQNGHTGNRVVQIVGGEENLGFLLARAGSNYFAHYADGLVEAINPVNGSPRPVPDPAVRTKRVRVPVSLQAQTPHTYKHASRYSGQMRRVVACQYSRGVETKFSYTWAKTHGILEWPFPRAIGATAGEESEAQKLRRFWILEVSASGVYAAPINFGLNCLACASDLSQYLPSAAELRADPGLSAFASELSLAWAYTAKNATGRIVRLLDAAGIAPAYAAGSPWYAGMGWAFSASGAKAANVLARMFYDGHDAGGTLDYYETRLVRLALSATVAEDATATLSATLVVGAPGRITFKRGDQGTMWVPRTDSIAKWDGVFPFANSIDGSGPVHVFHDGEEEILTSWSQTSASVPASQTVSPTPPQAVNWHGIGGSNPNNSGPHILPNTNEPLYTFVCQWPNGLPPPVDGHDCSLKHYPPWLGSGASIGAYTEASWGFSIGATSLAIQHYSRSRGTSVTVEHETPFIQNEWISGYEWHALCTSCGGGSARIKVRQRGYTGKVKKTLEQRSEARTGSSVLVLFPTEREAVLGIKVQKESATGSRNVGYWASGWKATSEVLDTIPAGANVTSFVETYAIGQFTGSPFATEPQQQINESSTTSSLSLRASGGVSLTRIGVHAALDVTPFLVWTKNVKEIAESSLFFMRGGLAYRDPALAPQDQKANHVLFQGGAYTFGGDFAPLTGKVPEAFIGQV